jgi:hypothetical protein
MRSKNDEGGKGMSRNIPSKFLGAAALVSVIAGVLISYEWDHTADSRLVRVTLASPEMMQLLRDEHGLMADMLKVRLANEKGLPVGGIHRD